MTPKKGSAAGHLGSVPRAPSRTGKGFALKCVPRLRSPVHSSCVRPTCGSTSSCHESNNQELNLTLGLKVTRAGLFANESALRFLAATGVSHRAPAASRRCTPSAFWMEPGSWVLDKREPASCSVHSDPGALHPVHLALGPGPVGAPGVGHQDSAVGTVRAPCRRHRGTRARGRGAACTALHTGGSLVPSH